MEVSQLNTFESFISLMYDLIDHFSLPNDIKLLEDFYYSFSGNNEVRLISNALTYLNINNLPVQLDFCDLEEVSLPIICQCNTSSESNWLLLIGINKFESVTVYSRGKVCCISIQEFTNNWNGTSILIDVNLNKEKRKIKITDINKLLISIILIVLLIYSLSKIEVTLLPLFLTKILGLFFSVILIWKNYEPNNKFLNNICSFKGKTNCDDVINSKYSKIFNINLSEIGGIYFITTIVSILFNSSEKPSYEYIFILTIINLLSLPYTLALFIIQGIVLKKWCLLCIATSLILWLEFAFYTTLWSYSSFGVYYLLSIISTFFLVTSIWYLIKPLIFKLFDYRKIYRQVLWFRRNRMIFDLLSTKITININNHLAHDIYLGNLNSPKKLYVISHIYCSKCIISFKELLEIEQLVDIQIIVRFIVENEDNNTKVFAKCLIELISKHGNALAKQSIIDWFRLKDLKKWKEQYRIDYENSENQEDLDQIVNWFTSSSLFYSPLYIFNNHLIPSIYQIEDLKLHVR